MGYRMVRHVIERPDGKWDVRFRREFDWWEFAKHFSRLPGFLAVLTVVVIITLLLSGCAVATERQKAAELSALDGTAILSKGCVELKSFTGKAATVAAEYDKRASVEVRR